MLPFLRPYLWRMGAVLAISLLATALGLAQPYISKLLIDRALLLRDARALWQVAGLLVAATIGGFALNILASWRHVALSSAMLFDIRVALLRHLQSLSPRFYGRFRLGDLMSRLNSDVSDVQRVAGDTALAALANVLFLAGSIAMMLWLDWRLFLAGMLLVPAAVWVFLRAQRRLTALTKRMRELGADIGSILVDTLMGMRVVAALNAQAREVARFTAANRSFVQAMLRMQMTSYVAGALPGTLLTASTAVVVLWGGERIIAGELSIGTLVAFLAYQQRVFAPVQGLLGLSATVASTRVALARIGELFDTLPEVTEAPGAVPLAAVRTGISGRGLTVSHGRTPILVDADFDIPAGCCCAVLGASGAGKSTLADLLVRFIDPDQGQVLIDGVDIRAVRLADLRRTVLLVDQSPFLFNDTLGNNIAYGSGEVDRGAIHEAACNAGLGPLLARLPEGLDTQAGERGLALSAGERQRVALARALLCRPQVLVLDEPTSALDGETELAVAGRLRACLPDATLIVITHRPALAALADRVLTVADGRLHREPRCEASCA
jgi:ATP-binding cassette, subfamily B, bacterial